MSFPVGADVFVVSLQKRGRVVELDSRGRYRIVVGGMATWCGESDLTTTSQGKKAKRERQEQPPPREAVVAPPPPSELTPGERRALRSIDLHGLTVPEALDALQRRMDAAIRAGVDRLEIVHGISGGRLRAAVRSFLAGATGIAGFEADPRNAGVTRVFF
jgi:DNA mismatch repair protein MutS2